MTSSASRDHNVAGDHFLQESHTRPLKYSGALDVFKSYSVTPTIGTEFEDVDLVEWLNNPDSDTLLRDLAITISQRGVVFFRKQDNLSNDLQKQLAQRLGQLSGKPTTSKLHIHPVIKSKPEDSVDDKEITVIDSARAKVVFGGANGRQTKQSRQDEWHSDVAFETVPPDYAILRMTELPKTGGAAEESSNLLNGFLRLIMDNHDLQVRHRWDNINDLAIWDNRSTYHAATPDIEGLGRRVGIRTVSVGEKPYLDPDSVSRRETLGTSTHGI